MRLRIVPRRPYSLHRTCQRFSRYSEVVDRFDGETYRRLVFLDDRPALIEVEQEGPPSRALLHVRLSDRTARAEADRILDRVLGARSAARAFYDRFRRDALLGPLIRRHWGLRVAGRRNVWETLLQIVLSQQIHLSLAHDMLTGLAERFGRSAHFDGVRYHDFPTPSALAAAPLPELRHLRMSRSKAETLKRLARAFESGKLSDEKLTSLSDDEAIALLTSYKGVGRWTAEFTLLRGLGRLDIFPAGDLGVVKYVAQKWLGYDEPASESEMRAFAERWRPYRGLALIYAYAELTSSS